MRGKNGLVWSLRPVFFLDRPAVLLLTSGTGGSTIKSRPVHTSHRQRPFPIGLPLVLFLFFCRWFCSLAAMAAFFLVHPKTFSPQSRGLTASGKCTLWKEWWSSVLLAPNQKSLSQKKKKKIPLKSALSSVLVQAPIRDLFNMSIFTDL